MQILASSEIGTRRQRTTPLHDTCWLAPSLISQDGTLPRIKAVNVHVYDACPASGGEHDFLQGARVREHAGHERFPNVRERDDYRNDCVNVYVVSQDASADENVPPCL